MLKFSDLSIGDYFYWGIQKSNIDGDYNIEFSIKQITIDDFSFMKENDWTEDDLNEFVKPIEITHDIMNKLGFSKEETWSGIVQYSYIINKKDGIEYHGIKLDIRECVYVTMDSFKDVVRNIKIDCFNREGSFKAEYTKADKAHYLHELQHLMRESGIEYQIKF